MGSTTCCLFREWYGTARFGSSFFPPFSLHICFFGRVTSSNKAHNQIILPPLHPSSSTSSSPVSRFHTTLLLSPLARGRRSPRSTTAPHMRSLRSSPRSTSNGLKKVQVPRAFSCAPTRPPTLPPVVPLQVRTPSKLPPPSLSLPQTHPPCYNR